jgi:plasmid stabilization system protein ParE
MPDETDKLYAVLVTATAQAAIREQVHYIAVDQQSPQNAAEWLDRVWTCIDDLEFLPLRYPIAEGYERLPYVVRRALLDRHLILFTVDEAALRVYVVGFRHSARLPRRRDLPSDPRA